MTTTTTTLTALATPADPTAPASVSTLVGHLGGSRIFAMAFDGWLYDLHPEDAQVSVTLMIARGLVRGVPGRATHVVVDLAGDDTYTVKLYRVPTPAQLTRGQVTAEVARVTEVYADRLASVVEDLTKLRLSLGPRPASRATSPGVAP